MSWRDEALCSDPTLVVGACLPCGDRVSRGKREGEVCQSDCPTWRAAWSKWFAERGAKEALEDARSVCLRCPVWKECLAESFSSTYSIREGVWGGTTPEERSAAIQVSGDGDFSERSAQAFRLLATWVQKQRGEVA